MSAVSGPASAKVFSFTSECDGSEYEADLKILNEMPLTQLLSEEQRTQIAHTLNLSEKPVTGKEMKNFCELIGSIARMAGLQKDYSIHNYYARLPWVCLKALIHNKVSENQVATFCLLYQAIEQFEMAPEYVRTFYSEAGDGIVAQQLIQKSPIEKISSAKIFEVFHISKDYEQERGDRYLKSCLCFTDLELAQFKAEMAKAPLSEQFFYTFKLPYVSGNYSALSWSPLYQHIINSVNCFKPVMHSPKMKDQMVFVLPSFTMLQIFITLATKEDAMTLTPRLGEEFLPEDIAQQKFNGKRIVSILLPGMKRKSKEGHYGGLFMDSFFEIYLGMRNSLISKKHRAALVHINNLLAEAMKTHSGTPDAEALKQCKWRLIQGELHCKHQDKFGAIFRLALFPPRATQIVINDMVRTQRIWHLAYNLTYEDLEDAEKAIYAKLAASIQKPLPPLLPRKEETKATSVVGKAVLPPVHALSRAHAVARGIPNPDFSILTGVVPG